MIKLIAFDAGWVLFRPGNWEILHKHGFTDDEGYWLLREGLGRTSDWIQMQLKKGKTSKQIIAILKKYYPKHADLLNRVQPLLKDTISVDFLDMVQLGKKLVKEGYQVEIWSDNGLGGPKQKAWQDSDIGLIPELKQNCPLYKKYPSLRKKLHVHGVYSKDIGVLKKDPNFFKKALKKHKGLKPEEVVFIEDRSHNIESAKSLGIHCIQFVAKTNTREKVPGVPVARNSKNVEHLLKKFLDTNIHKLYNYAPKEADVLNTGLWSPVKASRESLSHYFGRAKTKTKKGVLAYLETVFSGRSRAISFLTKPMTKECCFYKDFKKDRVLYSVDFDKLQKAGLIEAIYRVVGKPCKKITADQILWDEKLPWGKVGKGLFFTKIPHYMVVLRAGIIPAEFIQKE